MVIWWLLQLFQMWRMIIQWLFCHCFVRLKLKRKRNLRYFENTGACLAVSFGHNISIVLIVMHCCTRKKQSRSESRTVTVSTQHCHAGDLGVTPSTSCESSVGKGGDFEQYIHKSLSHQTKAAQNGTSTTSVRCPAWDLDWRLGDL